MTTQRLARLCAFAALSCSLLLAACGGGDPDEPAEDAPTVAGVLCLATGNHTDGDTFRCTTSTGTLTVRVAAIDAPETGQDHSEESRQRLEQLTPAGTLVDCYANDRFGRSLCRVYTAQGFSVQAMMLLEGMAWYGAAFADEQTAQERLEFPLYESTAFAARRGLWRNPNPQAPWECRAKKAAGGSCR